MKNHDVQQVGVDAVAAHVLELTKNTKVEELVDVFQKFLACVRGRNDYPVLEMVIGDTLLRHDFVMLYLSLFEESGWVTWCRKNVAHLVRQCPDTLMVWMAHGTSEMSKDAVGVVARELLRMPEKECLRLLLGDFDEPFAGYREIKSSKGLSMGAQKRLHRHLQETPLYWQELSPAWVATPEMKEAAHSLGWTPDCLPGMVYRNIWEPEAEQWLGKTPYPYTLMACEMFRCAQNGEMQTPKHIECIDYLAQTTTLDIALAERIIAHVPHTDGMTLHRPSTIKALEWGMQQPIDGFVQAHVAMGNLDALARGLARGEVPQMEVVQNLALPELGTP